MNLGMSKGMVFELREVEMFDFKMLHRVSVPTVGENDIGLGGEKMKKMRVKYLETVFSKYGDTGEINVVIKGGNVIGAFAMVMEGEKCLDGG